MKKKLICKDCGSDNVSVDAYAQWNEATQKFDLLQTFDKGHFCNDCENACTVEWKKIEPETKHTTEICFNCGADRGLHHYETLQCPKNGMEEIDINKKQEWENTIFQDSGLAKLHDAAPELFKGLRDMITWAQETAVSLLKDEEILPRGFEKWEKLVEKLS